MRFDALLTEK